MKVFSYRQDAAENQGLLVKGETDAPAYLIDFAEGLPSGVTISSAASVALTEDVATDTTNCVTAAGTVSGTTVKVLLLTFGASGTGAATDGIRRRIRTTATLSAGGPLIYDVMVRVKATTYNPDAD